ncbi:TraY domain-containing protein, partial [Raoultella ornithinolytica]|uniref:TraY domain-containing protein n=1 Tax=Raoultella ornithinolytica TaxID=54291 RepID=UPI003990B7E2
SCVSKRYTNTGNKNIVSVYLDDDTHAVLVSAKNRSGRTKSTEVAMRLKDHLRRFPNYIFSEQREEEER